MKFILDHNKLTVEAESEFEEGYLGELLSGGVKMKALKHKNGNVKSFFIIRKSDVSELPKPIDFDDDDIQELEPIDPDTDEAEKIEVLSPNELDDILGDALGEELNFDDFDD